MKFGAHYNTYQLAVKFGEMIELTAPNWIKWLKKRLT